MNRAWMTAVTTMNGNEPESGVHGEILVNCPHSARTFSNGCGDPLHRSQPDIADGEYSGCRGLERQRISSGKDGIAEGITRKGSIGEDEPLLVKRNRAINPRRSGYCADEAEEGNALLGVAASRWRVLEDDGFKVRVAIESTDLGVRQDLDVGIGRDAVDEVCRHAV